MQAEPEQVVGLVGVLDEVLELVQDVPVQESEEQPVGVQCVGRAEPGADEQVEEVFQGPQGRWRPSPEGAGQRPG